MEHEIVVEGFVLQVEVTHCVNEPARPGSWESDWDAMGERELEFVVQSARCYDEDGIPMDLPSWQFKDISTRHYTGIVNALWVEIDSLKRRERRFAA